MIRRFMLGLLAACHMGLAGCATDLARVPVPEKLASAVTITGMENVRTWGDQSGSGIQQFLERELPEMRKRRARGTVPSVDILALSGGADDGAFGAGFLAGWSAQGNRPDFNIVTGISAGALIAPFAFLGRGEDRNLEAMFRNRSGEDIYRANVLPGLLGGSAIADSAPLAGLIARYVDHRMVARLAQARGEGRLLIIGTTNLDAQRPVYWDIGRIAQHGGPDALNLIRTVLLASASIPGVFPPVNITVTAGDKSYTEMHVDGGPTREVFFAPGDFSFRKLDTLLGQRTPRRLWVIRNGKVTPDYAPVPSTALAISQRSIETLTKYQGIGDLTRMYHNSRAEGIEFNLIAIPGDFNAPRPQPFDRGYMNALFDVGVRLGREGGGWTKVPPGVVASGG